MKNFLLSICIALPGNQGQLDTGLIDTVGLAKYTNTFHCKQFVPVFVLSGFALLTLPEESPANKIRVQAFVSRNFPSFRTHIDDILWAVPLAGMYALRAGGVSGKNDLLNTSLLFFKAQLFTEIIIQPLKYTTCVMRPDSTARNSFPSGHTARAFAAATCLHRELGNRNVWYSIGGYSIAATTGVLRILNNRHWLTDVLAGTAVGILSAQLAYGTHRYRWGKYPVQLSWIPLWIDGSEKQLMFVLQF